MQQQHVLEHNCNYEASNVHVDMECVKKLTAIFLSHLIVLICTYKHMAIMHFYKWCFVIFMVKIFLLQVKCCVTYFYKKEIFRINFINIKVEENEKLIHIHEPPFIMYIEIMFKEWAREQITSRFQNHLKSCHVH